jgi:SPP1 gp7 family putative phage head morphogenesis protein
VLPIQRLRPAEYEPIEKQLLRMFREIIFNPVVAVLREVTTQAKSIFNSTQSVVSDALVSGTIQYAGGIFSGKYNAQISKAIRDLGAVWDNRKKQYYLSPAKVPSWVKTAAALAQAKAERIHIEIKAKLDETQKNLARIVREQQVDVTKTQDGFEEGFKTAAEKLGVGYKLTPESKRKLAEDYNDNIKLYVKKFSQEQIDELRGMVEENADSGFRYDSLVDKIGSRFDIAKRKAKFLARQETALFMSKFRQQRFSEAGVHKYEWSAVGDERTRDDHRKLSGRVFLYSDPPVTDSATGQRNNPGEDFNCRCVDIPILEKLGA